MLLIEIIYKSTYYGKDQSLFEKCNIRTGQPVRADKNVLFENL